MDIKLRCEVQKTFLEYFGTPFGISWLNAALNEQVQVSEDFMFNFFNSSDFGSKTHIIFKPRPNKMYI